MYFKVHLQLAYFSFSFTLSNNKDNMLIFYANTYKEALDMVQKSQQFYKSDSVLGGMIDGESYISFKMPSLVVPSSPVYKAASSHSGFTPKP